MGFHLSDAATATEVAQTQVVSRANEMIDGVIEPVVTALEDEHPQAQLLGAALGDREAEESGAYA